MRAPFSVSVAYCRRRLGGDRRRAPATVHLGASAGSRDGKNGRHRSRRRVQPAGAAHGEVRAARSVRQRRLRRSRRSPVNGCGNASRAACRNCRARPRLAARRRRGRRRPAGRSPPGGRGSGASARSRAARAAARARARARSTSKCVTASRGVSRVERDRASGRRGRGRSAPRSARCASAAGRGRARGTCARAPRSRTSSDEPLVRLLRPRDDHQPGRVAVEAVHDPGPLRVAAARSSRRARRRACPLAWPAPGMDDEPGRLVDDEQVLVLPRDRAAPAAPARPARRLGVAAARPPRRPRAGSSSAARRRRRARPPSTARSAAAREPTCVGEEAVEPRPGRAGGTSAQGRFTAPRRRACAAAAASAARSATTSAREQDRDADDDERVGEVERRPASRGRGSRSRDRGGRGRRGSRRCRRSAGRAPPGSTGWREPRAREEDEHPDDGDRRQRRSRPPSRCEKSPNAIPEFCTWWIESGPTTCTDSSSASVARDDVLRQLVGDDGRDGDRARARPTATRPAPSERSATETGASPFVDEPTRTSASAAAPRSAHRRYPRSASRWSSMQSVAHGRARSRSSPIGLPQRSQVP